MIETPFFFERGPWRLFAVLHEPSPGSAALPFVFCHPFAEEKLWAHRVFVTFARELARRGHAVLRFDSVGNGDSSGSFSESSLETGLADIVAAIDLLKARTGAPRVGLLGLRLGASLAFRAAAGRPDVDRLVLWSPITAGAGYLQELLRINVTTQLAVYHEVRQDREALGGILAAGGMVNIDGYEIGKDLADQLGALSLLDEAAAPAGPCLIVQVERNGNAKPARDLERLARRVPGGELRIAKEEPFWREILRFYETAPHLFDLTLGWLGHP